MRVVIYLLVYYLFLGLIFMIMKEEPDKQANNKDLITRGDHKSKVNILEITNGDSLNNLPVRTNAAINHF